MTLHFSIILVILAQLSTSTIPWVPLHIKQTLFTFPYFNFTFESTFQTQQYFNEKRYTEIIVNDIAISHAEQSCYVALPRLKSKNTPATLAIVDYSYSDLKSYMIYTEPVFPLLVPFPSFELNNPDTPFDSLVSVTSIEIDQNDILWVLDSGRIGFQSLQPGTAKIWSISSITGEPISRFAFPPEALAPGTTYLSDLAYDSFHSRIFVANAGLSPDTLTNPSATAHPSIFFINAQTFDLVEHLLDTPQVQANSSYFILSNGSQVFNSSFPWRVGPMAITLDIGLKTLHWSCLSNGYIFSLPLDGLFQPNGNPYHHTLNTSSIKSLYTGFSTQILAASDSSDIISFDLNTAVPYSLSTTQNDLFPFSKVHSVNGTDHVDSFVWPSAAGFDHFKWLLVGNSRLAEFLTNSITWPSIHPFDPPPSNLSIFFSIYRLYVNYNSYLDSPEFQSDSNPLEKHSSQTNWSTIYIWLILLSTFFVVLLGYVSWNIYFHYIKSSPTHQEHVLEPPEFDNPVTTEFPSSSMYHPAANIAVADRQMESSSRSRPSLLHSILRFGSLSSAFESPLVADSVLGQSHIEDVDPVGSLLMTQTPPDGFESISSHSFAYIPPQLSSTPPSDHSL